IAVAGAADDYRAAGASIEESNPAQDQGAHDALAELGLFDHQIPQPPRRDNERLGGFGGNGIDQRRAAGQLRKLAHERARTMPHDRLGMSLPATLRNVDPAPQDEESARRNLAGRNHALPGHIGFALTEPFQPLDLFRLQHRKDLLASGFDQRMYR